MLGARRPTWFGRDNVCDLSDIEVRLSQCRDDPLIILVKNGCLSTIPAIMLMGAPTVPAAQVSQTVFHDMLTRFNASDPPPGGGEDGFVSMDAEGLKKKLVACGVGVRFAVNLALHVPCIHSVAAAPVAAQLLFQLVQVPVKEPTAVVSGLGTSEAVPAVPLKVISVLELFVSAAVETNIVDIATGLLPAASLYFKRGN